MRAITISKQGTPIFENVGLVNDWPDTAPKPGEALIRTEANALNQLDLWVGRGVPGLTLDYPRVSGSDACGIIESVGEGVDESWIGQRVILNAAVRTTPPHRPDSAPALDNISMIGEHTNGVNAERFTVPVAQLCPVGEDADPVEAAAFGLTFLTAWRCLITRAELRPGQSLLITGIGGGVALAGLAIGRHFGCPVYVTSRSQAKIDRAIELGAVAGIVDTGNDWSREVRQMTGKRGVDVCLDSVGKATHLFCIKSLARGGGYVTPGCTTGPDATTDLARIFWNQLRVIGSTMGDMAELAAVTALFRAGHLKPVVDSVHRPENASDAYARLESGEQFGKVVIDWRK